MANAKPRLGRMTRYETAWVNRILDSGLGQEEPFRASQAVDMLFDARRADGDGKLNNIPNQHRLNTVLKKCKRFSRTKSSSGVNMWTVKEGEE
jgi:hypothetical protein